MKYLIKRDMIQGIWKKKQMFLLASLITWSCCLTLSDKIQGLRKLYALKGTGTLMDYWIFLIQGKEPYEFSITDLYEFPIFWLLFFSFLLIITNMYPMVDLEQWGYQVVTHSKSRQSWWFGKCIWCAVSVFSYFALALLTISFFALIQGVSFSLKPSWYVMESYGRDGFLTLSTWKSISILFLQPFFLAVLLGILQMVLSICLNALPAFCMTFTILIISAYWKSLLLCGNLGMSYRMSAVSDGGLNSTLCLLLLLLEIIFCTLAGAALFARKDIC
ncbi:MAG: hypothetical protein J1E62_05705 [Lachnospiraceae bacterium]|nr:hypothetical protein [Lachnospiraceae bacterium]